MSIFNFEETFSEVLKESRVNGYKVYYSNRLTESEECYINEKDEIYDLDHNLMEDQGRYRKLIESEALIRTRLLKSNKSFLSEINYI